MKIIKTLSSVLHHIWRLSASGKKLFGPFLGLALCLLPMSTSNHMLLHLAVVFS